MTHPHPIHGDDPLGIGPAPEGPQSPAVRIAAAGGIQEPPAPAVDLESLRDRPTIRERIALAVIIAYCLFPMYWLVKLSMQVDGSSGAGLLPERLTLVNYAAVIRNPDFIYGFLNSILIAGAATLISITIGGAAAYALSRLPVSGGKYILFLVLAVSMFPAIAIIGPLFDMWRTIGLFDTRLGLVIPSVTFSLPLAIWIMASFFRELPRDLEHAAYMDGASPIQAFRKVMLPLAAPGVFTAAILVFIGAWNEFIFALSLTATRASRTVPVVISQFQGADSMEIPIGSISAAAVIVMVPLIIAVAIFQRRIVSGLTAGGVKG